MRTWQRERSTCVRKLCPPGVLQTAKIPPKFSTLSRSMSIPPHLVTFPHLHSRPPPTIVGNFIGNNSKGKRLVVGYKPYYRELSHFLQPPSLQSPLAIFFPWLSGAISPHLAAQAPPVCPLSTTASKLRLCWHPLSPSKPCPQRIRQLFAKRKPFG